MSVQNRSRRLKQYPQIPALPANVVVPLFRASRWVADWEALGGRLHLGEGPFGPGGEIVPMLLEMKPTYVLAYSPEWRRLGMMVDQLGKPGCRSAVIEHLQRRQETRGW
jgi:hypothetical protein